jgi:hypothetical protein
LQTGHIQGVEALVRWQHLEHGLPGPASSSPWPSGPASSTRSPAGSWTPPSARPPRASGRPPPVGRRERLDPLSARPRPPRRGRRAPGHLAGAGRVPGAGGDQPERHHDRPLDHRPRPQPGPAHGRRGGRDPGRLAEAGGARLRHRPRATTSADPCRPGSWSAGWASPPTTATGHAKGPDARFHATKVAAAAPTSDKRLPPIRRRSLATWRNSGAGVGWASSGYQSRNGSRREEAGRSMSTAMSTAAPERARWPRLAASPHPRLRGLLPHGYAGFTEATGPRHLRPAREYLGPPWS